MRKGILGLSTVGCVALLVGCDPVVPQPPPTPTPTPQPTSTPEATPTPIPAPTPYPYIPRKQVDVARFYNGITIESELKIEESPKTAAVDRNRLDSYLLEMKLRIRMPEPARTLEQILQNDPKLPKALPSLPDLLANAKVSPDFATLYENKTAYIQRRLGRLEEILSRHNFYDCDTILQLTHPETGRRALFISSDMDLNVDGSDGDRNVEIDGSSPFFQPQTSYRWPKQTDRPNQFLESTEARLKEVREELKTEGLTEERKKTLQNSEQTLRNRIIELNRWSFLISDTDPYIVLPGFMLRSGEGPFAPKLGDYAVVIYNDRVYPAILGDAGPSFKMGEASMRICREINPKTSGIQRAVSNIRVHYVIFPGSGKLDEAGPPDLDLWFERSQTLFEELGGRTEDMHHWEDLVKPWPTPTPDPTPTPEPTPEEVENTDLEEETAD